MLSIKLYGSHYDHVVVKIIVKGKPPKYITWSNVYFQVLNLQLVIFQVLS